MRYIELKVRTAQVVHGFDKHNQEIIEQVNEEQFVTKLIALDRILSVSEQYVLVTGSHGRVMYWEYTGSLVELRNRLQDADLLVD